MPNGYHSYLSTPASFTQYLEHFAEINGLPLNPLYRGAIENRVRTKWRKKYNASFPNFSITIDLETGEPGNVLGYDPYRVFRYSTGNLKDIGDVKANLDALIRECITPDGKAVDL